VDEVHRRHPKAEIGRSPGGQHGLSRATTKTAEITEHLRRPKADDYLSPLFSASLSSYWTFFPLRISSVLSTLLIESFPTSKIAPCALIAESCNRFRFDRVNVEVAPVWDFVGCDAQK
jgi:hypothetical protein